MKLITYFLAALFFCTFIYAQPPGKSMIFNGTNDYITVPDNSSLDQDSSITIEAWINPCDVNSSMNIATKLWCVGGNYAYNFAVVNGKLYWDWDQDGGCSNPNVFLSDSVIIQPNTWHHIAIVHSIGAVKFYHNGIFISGSLISGSYGSPIYNSNQPLRIGTYKILSGATVSLFKGRLDEFRFWSRPLSALEILSRMNDTLVGNEPGLIAYYNMENTSVGSGVTVPNGASSTGTTNDGTTFGSGTTPTFLDNSTSFDSLDLGPDSMYAAIALTLDAKTSGTSYLWQNGTTGSTLTTTTTGWYWVDATIGNCTVRDSVYFTLLPLAVSGCSNFPCGEYGERQVICTASGDSKCVSVHDISELLSRGAVCGPCQEPDGELASHSVIAYPNPCNNHLNIRVGTACNRIRLINLRGGAIKEEFLDKPGVQFEMEMGHYPKGVYILEIRFPDGNTVRNRIIKM